jgi:hypothetical protein
VDAEFMGEEEKKGEGTGSLTFLFLEPHLTSVALVLHAQGHEIVTEQVYGNTPLAGLLHY